ncbi:hypothetical protein [Veronia pacifica]|uniref:hypothetical protein n=1 Tax=Veronia pacifica TaxID=1080227 RepID=UPI00158639CD|nr:hypothetical protein [Veronia pacifica]
MKHRRYSSKRLKQMMNEVLPDRASDMTQTGIVEKKNEDNEKQHPVNLEEQQK